MRIARLVGVDVPMEPLAALLHTIQEGSICLYIKPTLVLKQHKLTMKERGGICEYQLRIDDGGRGE
jgi:hypothetical protein